MTESDQPPALPSRFAFTTDELPCELDDRARLLRWREMTEELYGSIDTSYAVDRPFFVSIKAARFGSVVVDELASTLTRSARTARNIAVDGNDDLFLGLNCGSVAMTHRQRNREVVHSAGSAILLSNAEPGEVRSDPSNVWRSVYLPRRRLLELVCDVEDRVARRIAAEHPAVQHLRRYLDIVLEPGASADDPLLANHAETTLLDLVALSLGAGRDAAELARMRGLRAARLQAILAEIKSGFADPAFSVRDVAARLGLTPRYVQDVLHETGTSFSERVLELRLQSARSMLARHSHKGRKVSDIAYASGFNDVSYFNRCFRRRFGATPRDMRTLHGA